MDEEVKKVLDIENLLKKNLMGVKCSEKEHFGYLKENVMKLCDMMNTGQVEAWVAFYTLRSYLYAILVYSGATDAEADEFWSLMRKYTEFVVLKGMQRNYGEP